MQRNPLRPYAATAACSLALSLSLLAACSGDAATPAPLDPESSGTSSAATESSRSPSPDSSPDASPTLAGPPPLPPQARGTTRASAGPFVRHWVDSFNYATRSLNTSRMRQISYPGCQACTEIAASVDRVRRAGGHFEGDAWSVKRSTLLPDGEPGRPQVRASIEYLPQVVVEAAGASPRRFTGGKTLTYTFELAARGQRWAVAGIVGVPQ